MELRNRDLVCVVSALCLLSFGRAGVAAGTMHKTEAFYSAAAAASHGWVELGCRTSVQNYGFSATANAGGPGGEAGGTVTRKAIRSSYCDVFAGRLTLNDLINAKGRFVLTNTPASGNASVIVGHGDSAQAGLNSEASQMGLALATSPPRFFAHLTFANGSASRFEIACDTNVLLNQVYDWDYAYDPAGNGGNGSLTVHASAVGSGITNTGVLSLSAAQRALGASFDSFGIIQRGLSDQTPAPAASSFIDGVEYTAATPVPTVQFQSSASSGLETVSAAALKVVLSAVQTQAVTVTYAVTGGTASNGVDYNLAPGSLIFNAGETTKTISIPIVNDSLTESDETMVVTLTGLVSGRPSLGIGQSGGSVTLSWPEVYGGYQLESRTNLASKAGWATVPNGMVVSNGQRQVMALLGGQASFFRLSGSGGGGGVVMGSQTNHTYTIHDDDAGLQWDNLSWFYTDNPNTRLFINSSNQLEWKPEGGGQYITRLPEQRLSQVGDKVEIVYLWLTDGAYGVCSDCFACLDSNASEVGCHDDDIHCIAGTSDIRVGLFQSDGQYITADGYAVDANSVFASYKGYSFRFGPNMLHDPGSHADPAGSGRWVDCRPEVHKTGAFHKKPQSLDNLMYSNDNQEDYIYGFNLAPGTFSLFKVSLERLSSSSVKLSITLNGLTQTWTDTSSSEQPTQIDVLAIHMRNRRPYSRLVLAKP